MKLKQAVPGPLLIRGSAGIIQARTHCVSRPPGLSDLSMLTALRVEDQVSHVRRRKQSRDHAIGCERLCAAGSSDNTSASQDSHKAIAGSDFIDLSGVPGGTRTPDLLLRRQLLYPVELRALEVEAREELVGAVGFELTTLCSQSRCATRLRYAPTRESAFYHLPETRTRSRAYLSAINIPCLGRAFLIFNRLFRH